MREEQIKQTSVWMLFNKACLYAQYWWFKNLRETLKNLEHDHLKNFLNNGKYMKKMLYHYIL